MQITAKMVSELRERTGAGMMDCKKALVQAEGDMEKAIEILREKGLAAAAKKAGRVAAEGVVETYITEDGKVGAVVEVNCETDFVGKNEDFVNLAKNLAKQAALSSAKTVEEILEEKYIADENMTVREAITSLIAKLGENMTFRRFERFNVENGVIMDYIHGGGRIAVMVQVEGANNEVAKEVAKELALQIAAANPLYLVKEEVPQDVIEKEKEIYRQQALNEGKPEKVVEKMVEGRLQKYFKEVCLLEQLWIRDQDKTIRKFVEEKSKEANAELVVKKFVRFEKGEGIEKKEENFAEEVMKQAKA
ncbi:translation elongation factor Ts [Thermobrachium celere]|uniref:Elongation factor Ts n=1 Tax=Thermobrachium celere DSM 8682 TaxID=941824 RepID=R7RRF3_9CLOT|nr:translation elongation factor Ts [Thermobrachium celere]GFR35834.1 elongation factor Ts [Thermobrachium celere]CDF57936.1 Translation elongation factor Ts [Thermobrachium celere DSM 8682]